MIFEDCPLCHGRETVVEEKGFGMYRQIDCPHCIEINFETQEDLK